MFLFQARENTTSIEPGSTITIPFTVATTTNGVITSSVTERFTVRATNDRGYTSTSPDSVTVAAGSEGTANSTVSLTVPPNATSGTDVTLTIEAENAAGTDINYAVLRFSVTAKVTSEECGVKEVRLVGKGPIYTRCVCILSAELI